jgi:hypothetical protein
LIETSASRSLDKQYSNMLRTRFYGYCHKLKAKPVFVVTASKHTFEKTLGNFGAEVIEVILVLQCWGVLL